jgi:hypothetical protein
MTVPHLALTKEAFFTEMSLVLDSSENFGIDHCSAATAKKIAELPRIQSDILIESGKSKPNMVLLKKLQATKVASLNLVLELQNEIMEDCYKIYHNAFNAPLPIILGGRFLRESSSIQELKNFGVLSSGTPAISRHLISSIKDVATGSIFCPSPWSLIRNDAFMLGALHSRHTFYIAGDPTEEQLWDEEEKRLKVLGREISILASCGYEQVADSKQKILCGATLVPKLGFDTRVSFSDLSYVDKTKLGSTILKFLSPVES